MTPEAQRIAIGKVCPRAVRKTVTVIFGHGFDEDEITLNPLTDLNAIHEAEKTLTIEQTEQYFQQLLRVCNPAFCAPAAKRVEAFLRTLDLWVENP